MALVVLSWFHVVPIIVGRFGFGLGFISALTSMIVRKYA